MQAIRRSHLAAGLLVAASILGATGCGADQPTGSGRPAVTEPVTVVDTDAVTVDTPFGDPGDTDFVPVRWLVPWEDGFLAIGIQYSTRLPDQFPPEVAELFPPEVVALFPEGLPATQQEAVDILEGAGLLDEVMAVFDANPEAMDALQSAPPPDAYMIGSWTADGDTWIRVRTALPGAIGDISEVVAAGDRLVIAAAAPAEDGGAATLTIASTVNLDTWDSVSFDIASREGAAAVRWATPISVAGDAEHWVAEVFVDSSTGDIELWSGSWRGEPIMVSADTEPAALLTTSAGFLAMEDRVTFSPDGLTWTEVTIPTPIEHIQDAAVVGDQVVAVARTTSATTSIYQTDATGSSWNEVEVPGLDDAFSIWNGPSGPAFIIATETPAFVANDVSQPDLWLLATDDARSWLLEDLDEGDPDQPTPPQLAAANGPTVLVGAEVFGWVPYTGNWQRFTITG